MGNNNIMPKGGFLRGVLAGLTLLSLIFIGLSVAFPLPVETEPEPEIVSGIEENPSQSTLETEESTVTVDVVSDTPAPAPVIESPETPEESTPEVTIVTQAPTPVESAPQIEVTPGNDIQIGGGSSNSAPLITAPSAPVLQMSAATEAPEIEEAIEAPDVSSENLQASNVNDTSTDIQVTEPEPTPTVSIETPTVTAPTEEPAGGVELTGQTLINTSEPETSDTEVTSNSGAAFATNIAEFSDDGDKPLISFILLAESVAETEVLAGFTTPITMAVSSDNLAANDIIASYRSMGGEAILLLSNDGNEGLRKGGNPADVPAILEGALSKVDGVLGVMDGPEGNVNQDTRMMSAILETLSQSGHAIMTVNGLGLNRTSIMAKEAEVPATDISRVIDTEDGTIAVIRELDKLVLQIGDQPSVTVFAQATPDMLFALKFWLESQKAQAVTIAPVSASILRN